MNQLFTRSLYDNRACGHSGYVIDNSTGVADTPAAAVLLFDIGAQHRRYGT